MGVAVCVFNDAAVGVAVVSSVVVSSVEVQTLPSPLLGGWRDVLPRRC